MTYRDIRCFCYLCYVGPFFLLGLFSDARKNPTLRFHLNQGIALACSEAIALAVYGVTEKLLGGVPFLSVIPSVMLIFVLLCSVALSLLGFVHVSTGNLTPLPVIGSFRLLK